VNRWKTPNPKEELTEGSERLDFLSGALGVREADPCRVLNRGKAIP